jgi:hypothetical protein
MAGYRLRLRGLRDGLLGRPVPLGALGLRSGHEAPRSGDEAPRSGDVAR